VTRESRNGGLTFSLPETNYDPVNHTLSPYSDPVSSDVFQSLSNEHQVTQEMFETFNAAVDPVAHSWEHETRAYANDDLLQKFLDATPEQVENMWLRFYE
jgi:hypothetical protein